MKTTLLLTIFLILAVQTPAEPWRLSQAGEQPAAFISGFLSGYAAHELGHVLVAESKGFDAEFDGATIIYPNAPMTKAERLQVSTAGFQTQWLVAESALRYRERNKLGKFGNSYNAGLVFSHLTITAAYLTVLLNHEDGDLQGASESTGISNDKLAGLAAIPALLDTWRLFGEDVPDWVPALSLGSKSIGIVAIWSY